MHTLVVQDLQSNLLHEFKMCAEGMFKLVIGYIAINYNYNSSYI